MIMMTMQMPFMEEVHELLLRQQPQPQHQQQNTTTTTDTSTTTTTTTRMGINVGAFPTIYRNAYYTPVPPPPKITNTNTRKRWMRLSNEPNRRMWCVSLATLSGRTLTGYFLPLLLERKGE